MSKDKVMAMLVFKNCLRAILKMMFSTNNEVVEKLSNLTLRLTTISIQSWQTMSTFNKMIVKSITLKYRDNRKLGFSRKC